MKQKISFKLIALIFFSLAIFFLTAFYLYAWTEPSTSPPGGNVTTPLNVSGTAQIKSGPLQVNGFRNIGNSIFDGNVGNINFNSLYPTTGNSPNSYSHYAIYEQPGAWTWPYPDLMIEYHTGISYVAYAGYGGHRFYTGYSSDASPTTLAFSVGEFDNNTRVYNNLIVTGTAYANGYALCQSNGTNCPASATNPALSQIGSISMPYGSLNISGSSNGYAGIYFPDQNRVFMVNSTYQGIWNSSTGWQWYWNNGTLEAGSVPISRIPDIGSASVNYAASAGTLATAGRSSFSTDDSGLHVINSEGTGSNVRLGSAWGRPGIYNNPNITIGSEGTIYFVTGNVERARIDNGGSLVVSGTAYANGYALCQSNGTNCPAGTSLGDWSFSGDNLISNGWGHIYTSSNNLHLDSYSGEMYLNYYYNNWVTIGNRDTGYLFIGNTQLYDDNDWFRIYSGANNRIYTTSYFRVDNNIENQGDIYSSTGFGGWASSKLCRNDGTNCPAGSTTNVRPLTGSYGGIDIIGTTNSYSGIYFPDQGQYLMVDGDGATGFYRPGYWMFYTNTSGDWYSSGYGWLSDRFNAKSNTGHNHSGESLYAANYYMPNTAYGFIGNNVYADTINTGSSGDPLEINYYRQGDVRICNGPAGACNVSISGNLTVAGQNVCRQDGTYCPAASTNADTVDGYHVSTSGTANTIPTRNGSGYLSPANWTQLDGYYGLYSPNNGAHFYPNDSAYGAWKILGTKNGYGGINYNGSTVLMMQDDLIGLYNERYGKWIIYGYGSSGNTYIAPNGGNVYVGGQLVCLANGTNCPAGTSLGDWSFSGDNLISNGWGHIYTSSNNLHLDSYSGEMYLNYYYNNWVTIGNRDTGYLFIGNTQLYDDNDWFRIYSGANNRIYTTSYFRVDNNIENQGDIYSSTGFGGWASSKLCRNDGTNCPGVSSLWTANGSNIYNANSGNVGINTTNPETKLDVHGKATISRDGGEECCGNDATLALMESTSGTGKRASISFHNGGVAEGTLELADNGPRRLKLYDNQGQRMGLEMSGPLSIGGPLSTSGDYLEIDGGSDRGMGRYTYFPNGNVYIGSGPYGGPSYAGYNLELARDSAGKPGGGAWNDSSDERLKKNIAPITGALEKIKQLRGVNFEWINPDEHGNLTGVQGGFLAQDVEKVFPEWVSEINPKLADSLLVGPGQKIKSLSLPFEFSALTVEAIKEQQKEIDGLNVKIDNLMQRIEELEKEVKK